MKFRAHDTFYIRKGWLDKGMKYIKSKPNLFIDKDENPMDVLGIGSNMVKALRYWLQAVGVIQESNCSGKRLQTFTPIGTYVFKYDRYIEELGTLHLLQYKLATNKDEATAWYYFFNEFNMNQFTKEDFIRDLENYIKMIDSDLSVAYRSLSDDFICIMNTYLAKYKLYAQKYSPENNLECPLSELGLIDFVNKEKKIYKKVVPSAKSFNPWVIMAIIADNANGAIEISLNELLFGKCNIGKVFNLDAVTMLDILYKIEQYGELKIIRTAGLDVVQLTQTKPFEYYIEKYYSSIESIEDLKNG